MTFRRVDDRPCMFEALGTQDGEVFAVTTATAGVLTVAFRRSTPLVSWQQVAELAHFLELAQRELDGDEPPTVLMAGRVQVRRTGKPGIGAFSVATNPPRRRPRRRAGRSVPDTSPPYSSSSSS